MGNCTTHREKKTAWRNYSHCTTIIQASSVRVITTVPEASLCHTSLNVPACHKPVLPVCNCISKCNTHFLPCGDIFIYVFKTGSPTVPRCCKGEALLMPKSTAVKASSITCCAASTTLRLSKCHLSLLSTWPVNQFTEHYVKYHFRLFHPLPIAWFSLPCLRVGFLNWKGKYASLQPPVGSPTWLKCRQKLITVFWLTLPFNSLIVHLWFYHQSQANPDSCFTGTRQMFNMLHEKRLSTNTANNLSSLELVSYLNKSDSTSL